MRLARGLWHFLSGKHFSSSTSNRASAIQKAKPLDLSTAPSVAVYHQRLFPFSVYDAVVVCPFCSVGCARLLEKNSTLIYVYILASSFFHGPAQLAKHLQCLIRLCAVRVCSWRSLFHRSSAIEPSRNDTRLGTVWEKRRTCVNHQQSIFERWRRGHKKKTRKDAGMKSLHLRDPFRWIELHKDHHSQGWGGGGGSQSLQTAIAAGQCWHCYRHHIVVAIYKTADSGATRAKGSKEENKIGTNQTQIGFFPLLSFFFLFIRPSLFPFSCGL